jgi:hypothetical protein
VGGPKVSPIRNPDKASPSAVISPSSLTLEHLILIMLIELSYLEIIHLSPSSGDQATSSVLYTPIDGRT